MEDLVARLREAKSSAKLVGKAPAFQQVIECLPRIATSDVTALVTGETGTGKELVARSIHYLSPRAAMPFVPVNCGALPDTLLESELFGHERGAFTDAHASKCGLIALAEKGTLFLDEVESLSPKAQVTLLRVLQDKKYRAIGSTVERTVDVRVIAATNAPLEELIEEGTFRSDLYYRLKVLIIHMPPLRDRGRDILLLANHFLKKHIPQGRELLHLSDAAQSAMLAYDWPGNVRQLENTIVRAIHMCRAKTIDVQDLGIPAMLTNGRAQPTDEPVEYGSFREMKQKVVESFESDYLKQLMQEHQGNITRAATAAGKDRRDLGKMLKKYGIDPRSYAALLARLGLAKFSYDELFNTLENLMRTITF